MVKSQRSPPGGSLDPLTHTLTGGVLARSGLGRHTPLAGATAMIAANAPDIDIAAYVKGPYFALAFRRGITHGLPAMLIWPFVITGAVLLFDRFVRRRRHPGARPVQPRMLLLVATIAVVTHPALDWLNNYGMRWLMPFSDRWSYGDAVFIIDPWIWLLLGAALFLSHDWTRSARIRWAALAILASAVIAAPREVPRAAEVTWIAALSIVAALYVSGFRLQTRGVRVAGTAVAAYMLGLVLLDPVETRSVRRAAERAGVAGITDVMVAPVPANPFAATVVIATAVHYHTGTLSWRPQPRLHLDSVIVPVGRSPISERAAQAAAMRDYLVWSRYPFFSIEARNDGYAVYAGDVRYTSRSGSLAGVRVRVW